MDKKFRSPFEATLTPLQKLESFLKVLSQRGSHFVSQKVAGTSYHHHMKSVGEGELLTEKSYNN